MSVDVEPIQLTTGSGGTDRVVLFRIDDREFTIPARPRPNIGLRYMKALRQNGDAVATAQLLEDLLGAEAYAALADFEDLEKEQLQQVMRIAQKITMGSLEDSAKGN